MCLDALCTNVFVEYVHRISNSTKSEVLSYSINSSEFVGKENIISSSSEVYKSDYCSRICGNNFLRYSSNSLHYKWNILGTDNFVLEFTNDDPQKIQKTTDLSLVQDTYCEGGKHIN